MIIKKESLILSLRAYFRTLWAPRLLCSKPTEFGGDTDQINDLFIYNLLATFSHYDDNVVLHFYILVAMWKCGNVEMWYYIFTFVV